VSSILQMRAEDSGFKDPAVADRAVYHYKRSLIAGPTAEAWKSVGVCAYRRAQLETSQSKRTRLLKDASRYLQEANVLDKERPQIIAWLAICAAELGQVQLAKQAVRQVLQFEARFDVDTGLELAGVLVRFSDEQRAAEWGGERGRLVQDGRYAQEAAEVARLVISRSESGRARHFLACALALNGEHGAAAAQFSAALPLLVAEDPGSLESAADKARQCAAKMPGEPQLAALVEEAIQVAVMEQQRSQGTSDALPAIDETGRLPEADMTQMDGSNPPPES
jgi:tetratricopeptide (TPR) repeat protein